MSGSRAHLVKIIIIGASSAGKTALIHRYVNNKFQKNYASTIGIDFVSKEVHVHGNRVITMQIWDTAGQERFNSLSANFYRGADCCVLVYDITDTESFQKLDSWRREFLVKCDPENLEFFPFFVFGNKADLGSKKRAVSTEQLEEWCQLRQGIEYFETSAKTNHNVEMAFQKVAEKASKYSETLQLFDDMPNFNVAIVKAPQAQKRRLC